MPAHKKQFLSYKKCREAVIALGITRNRQYRKLRKSIIGAPSNPEKTYKGEWSTWDAFLGKPPKVPFLSYEKCQKAAISLGIKSEGQWKDSYSKIPDAPSHPEDVYKKKWPGYPLFLNTTHAKERLNKLLVQIGVSSTNSRKSILTKTKR